MSTAANALPAFLRSFDLPEPGELRRVARVYVWGRWFVLSIATFAWLYPLNVAEVVYAPNVALAMLLFSTNGYLHYRLATERTVSWRWPPAPTDTFRSSPGRSSCWLWSGTSPEANTGCRVT